jgi:hypothetical protein
MQAISNGKRSLRARVLVHVALAILGFALAASVGAAAGVAAGALTSRNDGAGLPEGGEPRTAADEQDVGRAQQEDGAAEREEAPADQGVDASRAHDPGQMDETSGQMLDLPGNNSATPTGVLQTGGTYVFNGSTSHVSVPDADSLDPQDNDITLAARVLVGGASLDDDSYDVVRKGFFDTPGGYYKMEIKRTADPTVGKLHCLFRGTGASVNKVANLDIVDGNWHTLRCVKTATSVVARVDGRSFARTGSAGSIANESIVMVGAKKAKPFDDVFDGSMDSVSIDIAQPDVAQ